MYSWKIIHGKHKRIALQSLINQIGTDTLAPFTVMNERSFNVVKVSRVLRLIVTLWAAAFHSQASEITGCFVVETCHG